MENAPGVVAKDRLLEALRASLDIILLQLGKAGCGLLLTLAQSSGLVCQLSGATCRFQSYHVAIKGSDASKC